MKVVLLGLHSLRLFILMAILLISSVHQTVGAMSLVEMLQVEADRYGGITFTDDETRVIFSNSKTGAFQIFDLQSGKSLLLSEPTRHDRSSPHIRVYTDLGYALGRTKDGLQFVDLKSGKIILLIPKDAIDFAISQSQLVVHAEQSLFLYNLKTLNLESEIAVPVGHKVESMTFIKNGESLVIAARESSGSSEIKILELDSKTKEFVQRMTLSYQSFSFQEWKLRHGHFIGGYGDKQVLVFNANMTQLLFQSGKPGRGYFSADEKYFIVPEERRVQDESRPVHIYDSVTFKKISETEPLIFSSFSNFKDSLLLFNWRHPRQLGIFDIQTGKLKFELIKFDVFFGTSLGDDLMPMLWQRVGDKVVLQEVDVEKGQKSEKFSFKPPRFDSFWAPRYFRKHNAFLGQLSRPSYDRELIIVDLNEKTFSKAFNSCIPEFAFSEMSKEQNYFALSCGDGEKRKIKVFRIDP